MRDGSFQCAHLLIGMNYWEIIADSLSKAGWSWGCVSALDRDGKRFVVRADEILTAFLEAERAIHQFAVSLLS